MGKSFPSFVTINSTAMTVSATSQVGKYTIEIEGTNIDQNYYKRSIYYYLKGYLSTDNTTLAKFADQIKNQAV